MTAETRKRRKYTDEFKRDAVSLVTEQGYSVAEAARSLGINSNLLGRWKHTFEEEASGIRLNADECEELKRLRKENRLLRMEKEIFYRGDIGSTNRRYKPLEVDFWQVGGRTLVGAMLIVARLRQRTHGSRQFADIRRASLCSVRRCMQRAPAFWLFRSIRTASIGKWRKADINPRFIRFFYPYSPEIP